MLKALSLVTVLLMATAIAAGMQSLRAAAEGSQVIADGDFEVGGEFACYSSYPPPVHYGGWATRFTCDDGVVDRVTSPVHGGSYAAQIDTRAESIGRYIYQDVLDTTACFTWTFQVYRSEGQNTAELVADWHQGGGFANPVSVVQFSDDHTIFVAWEASTQLSLVLSPGSWHEVVVQADGSTGTQTLLIDGNQEAKLTSLTADFAPESIIMGDVSGSARHGLYTYDDVSLEAKPCPTPVPCGVGGSGLDTCDLDIGDILLERGGGSWNQFWIGLGGSYYAHSGLYAGMGRVAQAVGLLPDDADEVTFDPITDTPWYTGDDLEAWAVVRPDASDAEKASAATYALAKANEDGVVFDIHASREDETKFYCSKLVWSAYQQVGVDVEANRGLISSVLDSWVTPDDLFYGSPVAQEKISLLGRGQRAHYWIHSPGHLTLIDPQGRRTGFDAATGGWLEEIPNAVGSGPDAEVETITVTGMEGEWQLLVTGFGSGEYTLEAGFLDHDDPEGQVVGGVTYPGEVDEFIVLDPDSGSSGQDPIIVPGGSPAVGGIAELPASDYSSLDASGSSGTDPCLLIVITGSAASLLPLAGTAWYARRRRAG